MVNKIHTSKYLIIFSVLFAPLFAFAAWTAPTSVAPGGNTEAPLNTGTTLQIKNGDFSVNAFLALLNSYFASKLGVGTASILATLDVTPTITATTDLKNIKSGLIYNGVSALTNYYATYIAAPTGSGSITNKYALVTEPTAGKVGIGTITPAAQLSVNGGIQVGDDTVACSLTKAGTVRWHGGAMEVCSGVAWTNVSSAGGCPVSGACPLGSSGATCATYSVATVNPPSSCPVVRSSTCSDGSWSPTPYAFASCGVVGCMNPAAVNYQPTATIDSGACYVEFYGCTNPSACNYDGSANVDNGMCLVMSDSCSSEPNNCGARNTGTVVFGCVCDAVRPDDEQSCPVGGCTDSNASNYNPDATYDDESCSY